jgi:hypothetical protein
MRLVDMPPLSALPYMVAVTAMKGAVARMQSEMAHPLTAPTTNPDIEQAIAIVTAPDFSLIDLYMA